MESELSDQQIIEQMLVQRMVKEITKYRAFLRKLVKAYGACRALNFAQAYWCDEIEKVLGPEKDGEQ